MKQILLWLRIIRPQTLFASLCPVLVGLMVTRWLVGQVGIADIFVFLYYGVIASWGTVWLQYMSMGQTFDWSCLTPVYAGAVCGLISMCVLSINNIRDMEDDRLVDKRTIPVRVGNDLCRIGVAEHLYLQPKLKQKNYRLTTRIYP